MKRVFIIHGWEDAPDSHWLGWLAGELKTAGFEVSVPVMPDANHPNVSKWLERLKLVVGDVDEETFFVGHSLGVITILKFLESLPHGQKAGGAVLVAGYPDPIGYDELMSFFYTPLKFEDVRKKAGKFTAIHSDNDSYVPLDNGYKLRNELGAKLVIVPGAGHFYADDGYTQLPIVRDEILAMME